MERYEAKAIEEKWQRVWREERAFEVPNPGPGELVEHAQKTYVLEMLPYPSGDLHMGHVRNYMLGEVVAHFRRRHGFAVMRPDGLRRLRAACRERSDQGGCSPRRIHSAQHRRDPRADGADGLGDRLEPRALDARALVLPLDAVALPPLLREGPRLSPGGPGQVVSQRPDGARERAGDRRSLRALRRGGRGEEPRAVVLQDHGLRGRAAGRDVAPRGVAGARAHDATELDRPVRRARTSSSASTTSARRSRSSRRVRIRCTARRSSCSRPSICSCRGWSREPSRRRRSSSTCGTRLRDRRWSAWRRRRTASSPGATSSTP